MTVTRTFRILRVPEVLHTPGPVRQWIGSCDLTGASHPRAPPFLSAFLPFPPPLLREDSDGTVPTVGPCRDDTSSYDGSDCSDSGLGVRLINVHTRL